jgi:hypothetical protein
MKSTKNTALLLAVLISAAAGTAALVTGCKHMDSDEHSSAHAGKYTCSMHPEVASDTAGKCPKCGMDLVKKN